MPMDTCPCLLLVPPAKAEAFSLGATKKKPRFAFLSPNEPMAIVSLWRPQASMVASIATVSWGHKAKQIWLQDQQQQQKKQRPQKEATAARATTRTRTKKRTTPTKAKTRTIIQNLELQMWQTKPSPSTTSTTWATCTSRSAISLNVQQQQQPGISSIPNSRSRDASMSETWNMWLHNGCSQMVKARMLKQSCKRWLVKAWVRLSFQWETPCFALQIDSTYSNV